MPLELLSVCVIDAQGMIVKEQTALQNPTQIALILVKQAALIFVKNDVWLFDNLFLQMLRVSNDTLQMHLS